MASASLDQIAKGESVTMLWWSLKNMLVNAAQAQSFMPTQATETAKHVDSLYTFLLVASLISCAILIGGMIYFSLKYKRQSNNDKTAYITHDTRLEILWSVIPLIIFLIVFAWGWMIYHDMRSSAKGALEIQVTGRQWSWEAEYKNGVKSSEVVVPVNRDVRIVLASTDVIHSFYVPSFRIKQDAVPGRYTAVNFKAEKMGEFHVFCTEFCGTSHSGMITKLKVVSQDEFDQWLVKESENGSLPPAQLGKKVFEMKCTACHYSDKDAVKIGPSLYNLFGKANRPLEGGETVAQVDENYIRESILNASAKRALGYPANGVQMTSFQGQLSEKEVSALIEFIKGLK